MWKAIRLNQKAMRFGIFLLERRFKIIFISEQFLQLWPVFYNYIPFDAVIFVFRVPPLSTLKKEKTKLGIESWGESRKIFKHLIVEEAFKDKPILLLINVCVLNNVILMLRPLLKEILRRFSMKIQLKKLRNIWGGKSQQMSTRILLHWTLMITWSMKLCIQSYISYTMRNMVMIDKIIIKTNILWQIIKGMSSQSNQKSLQDRGLTNSSTRFN